MNVLRHKWIFRAPSGPPLGCDVLRELFFGELALWSENELGEA